MRYKQLYTYFLLLPFIAPEFLETIPLLDNLINVLKVLVFIYLMFRASFLIRENKTLFTMIFILLAVPIVSTIALNGDVNAISINSISILTYSVACLYLLSKGCMKYIWKLYFILILLNLITIVAYPEGLYIQRSESGNVVKKWLLGFDDQSVIYYMPTVILSYMIYFLKKDCLWMFVASAFASFVSSVLTNSSASILAIVILLLAYRIVPYKKPQYFFNFANVFVAFNILLVSFNVTSYFSFIISDLLQKSSDLTGRLEIWSISILNIIKSPIYGYGFTSSPKFFTSFYMPVMHCHNYLLNLAYEGGVMAISAFYGLLLYLASYVQRIRRKELFVICYISTLVFLIPFAVDAYQKPMGLYLIFIVVYYASKYEKDLFRFTI